MNPGDFTPSLKVNAISNLRFFTDDTFHKNLPKNLKRSTSLVKGNFNFPCKRQEQSAQALRVHPIG